MRDLRLQSAVPLAAALVLLGALAGGAAQASAEPTRPPCGSPDQHSVTAEPTNVLAGQSTTITVIQRLEPCYPDESQTHDITLYARPAGTEQAGTVVARGKTDSQGRVTFAQAPTASTEYSDLQSFTAFQNGPRVATVVVEGGRRLAGADRYATAAAIARASFPDGSAAAVLARGDDFADALAGSAAAAITGGGPVLLTQTDRLPAATASALADLMVSRVAILGGTQAVSAAVEQQLRDRNISVTRYSGTDRYGTAADVARACADGCAAGQLDGKRTVVVVNGTRFGDAITVGPIAYATRLPLLLVTGDSIPAATQVALDQAADQGRPYEQAVVVGGPAAISDAVLADLNRQGVATLRLAGNDRTATSVEVAKFAQSRLGWTLTHVNITRGDAFPDALAGGPHGGDERAPILLTQDPVTLTDPVRRYLRDNASSVNDLDVFGNAAAVSDDVVRQARAEAGDL